MFSAPSITAKQLASFDIYKMRPWISGADGKSYYQDANGEVKPSDIPGKLTREQWKLLDERVKSALVRMPVTNTIREHCCYSGFDGMAKMALEHETVEEVRDWDTGEEIEKVGWQMKALPLPITNTDFPKFLKDDQSSVYEMTDLLSTSYSATLAVAETIDDATIAALKETAVSINIPRLCKPSDRMVVARNILTGMKYYGPFLLFHGKRWTSEDILTKDTGFKPRDGIIEPIIEIPSLGNEVLLVQATPDVARIVVGREVVAVQWEHYWKVLGVIVAQVRRDFYGNVGILLMK